MVPVGTIPPDDQVHHYQNNNLSQSDLFRESKSAPARLGSRWNKKAPRSASKSFNWRKLPHIFIGHAPGFTQWAAADHGSRAIHTSLFFIESSLRSIGNVTFCNNPFSGLIILIAMLLSSLQTTLLACVALTFGIATAVLFLQIPIDQARGGGVTFNCYLTGTVVGILAADNVIVTHPEIIVICMLLGILTVAVWKGLNGIAASTFDFPLLNFPFHVIMLLYLLSGLAAKYEAEELHSIKTIKQLPMPITNLSSEYKDAGPSGGQRHNTHDLDVMNMYTNASFHLHQIETAAPIPSRKLESFDWERLPGGVILAPSQVFGTKDVWTSLMVWISLFLYSPIILIQAATGSATGSLVGIFLSNPEDYELVYNGSWSYNSLFTSAALSLFLVVSVRTWLLAAFGSIITALLYGSMVKCHVPVLGIPFMLATWLLLPSISSLPNTNSDEEKSESQASRGVRNGTFYRICLSEITTPELHRQLLMLENIDKTNSSTDKYKSNIFAPTPQRLEHSNSILPL